MEEFIANLNQAIINPLIALLFAVALVVFAWGLFSFVAHANNEEARNTGKRHMLWGIVGLFVMVAVFGIIQILLNTFGIELEGGQSELLTPDS